MIHVSKATHTDVADIKRILDSSELFPSDILDDMIAGYLNNEHSEEYWFVAREEGQPALGFGYCIPEELTDGTYNLLAIAVMKESQGKGIGHTLMRYIEQVLLQENKRILIVETSSSEEYKLTRAFYEKQNYQHVASIPEFWKAGEHKVVYWKKLHA